MTTWNVLLTWGDGEDRKRYVFDRVPGRTPLDAYSAVAARLRVEGFSFPGTAVWSHET